MKASLFRKLNEVKNMIKEKIGDYGIHIFSSEEERKRLLEKYGDENILLIRKTIDDDNEEEILYVD